MCSPEPLLVPCKPGVEPSVGCTKRHPGTLEFPLVVRVPIHRMVAWGRQVRSSAEGRVEEQGFVCVAVGIDEKIIKSD
jgi:hypothetical protein